MYKEISRLIQTLRVLKVMINCRRFYMKKMINFLMILELKIQKFFFIGLVFQHRISVSAELWTNRVVSRYPWKIFELWPWNITVISIFQSPKHIFFSFQQHISKVQVKNSAKKVWRKRVETQCLVEQTIVETNHRGFLPLLFLGLY